MLAGKKSAPSDSDDGNSDSGGGGDDDDDDDDYDEPDYDCGGIFYEREQGN